MGVLGIDPDRVDRAIDADPAGELDDRLESSASKSTVSAPRRWAIRRRSALPSTAMIRLAPMSFAETMVKRPTGPQPNTATVSPSLISASSAPK